ncbi:Gfo/Idh/MocA family oxidoreductase [Streptomyces sp. NPDC096012]|uniref:Gfo/Idh/MocA family oxidoreductase n=1 Tax=Streptomyces sp. NPDC096012 TaxID=3155684 RepID=UPI00336AC0B3
MTRPRVLVAGTGFGRAYLAAFERADFGFELAGILASGGARSRACAAHHGVPLWTTVEEVPDDVDLACVVIGGVMNGGPGPRISQALMRRGVHVLQEHPLHPDELAQCLRAATESGVVFRLNTHYPHVEPVHRFIGAARELVARQRPLFLDVTCAFQVLYTVFDILGQALGSIRPHGVDGVLAEVPEAPYRSLTGRFAGVPMSFRLQNELVPSDPDNYSHLFHRVTLGTDGGHLTLVNTHGPVQWSMRPHMPGDMRDLVSFGDSAAPHLKVPSVEHLGPAQGASYSEVLRDLWPQATARAIAATWDEVRSHADSRGHVQYHMTLAKLAMRVSEACGPVRLRHPKAPPELLTASDLLEAP